MATLAVGFVALSGPSNADITAVQGSAYGYFSRISLFGGPPADRGPAPTVTLPPGGSATAVTATVPSGDARYGPGIFFTSGPITVSTQGTVAGGSVTSSADIQTINTSGAETFTASRVASTCTATENGVSGSTTITGGTLQTDDGQTGGTNPHPAVTVPVPANPAPNTTIEGHLHSVGDTFRYIFNEQIRNPDGSITVNAGHQVAIGPTAVGDLFFGQVVCGVTPGPGGSTTSSSVAPSSTTSSSTTSSSVAPSSTTSSSTTSSSVAPSSTTSSSTTSSSVAPSSTSSSSVAPSSTTSSSTTSSSVAPSSTTSSSTTSSSVAPSSTSSSSTTSTTRVAPSSTTSSSVVPSSTTSSSTTSTTRVAPSSTTSTTRVSPPPFADIVCRVLRQLRSISFLRPFLDPFLARFGC